ncbi:MAG: response regulator [bacterium]|nr:response regulator [bacterium]
MTRVLVIEDEQPVRDHIVEMLTISGYRAQGAFSGKVGIRLAKQIHPDVIVCDISMGDMDGYKVLEELRQDSSTAALPFIFITAHADRQSMRKGMELGADDYLTKPFSNEELVVAIQSRLARFEKITSEAENRFNRARQNMMTLIARRIHHPLETVNAALDTVSKQMKQLSQTDMHNIVHTAAGNNRRITRLVDQLALLVRLESKLVTAQTIQRGSLKMPLRDVWQKALEDAKNAVDAPQGLEWLVQEQDRTAQVVCDYDALSHALAEVIINAMTYSPDGSSITLAQRVEEGKVYFSVADRGPGMSPRHINNALGDSREATDGLGLKLARRVLEAHSGGIALHSAPNEGTTAVAWLPVAT